MFKSIIIIACVFCTPLLADELVGDFNLNGDWDAGDVTILRNYWDLHQEYQAMLDIFPPDRPDGRLTAADYNYWFSSTGTKSGDANVDGVFNSADFIEVMAIGEYEDAIPMNSEWGDGDWEHDLEFTSRDIVDAMSRNWYSTSAVPVPEPPTASLAIAALLLISIRSRHPGALFRSDRFLNCLL